VGGIKDYKINFGFYKQGKAGGVILRGNCRAHDKLAGFIGRGVGKIFMFLHVRYGDKPFKPALVIHYRKFFNAEFGEFIARLFHGRLPFHNDYFRRHHFNDGKRIVAAKSEVAVCDYPF